ncbi:ubiquinone biosynthesis monooxygenase COQ6, mitochondrial [Bradysia coprophila]|uniref:ubiquinone biosynthesis monooxygenase COQ6, mitochondrial n=1 Tax=Bradysia coprophila TaxID=38358 RepID=UPI00187D7F4E|nr:ubiquinone biosynthesis monooxygenase COQ6, mitochondrial [Bradysia coprophila]
MAALIKHFIAKSPTFLLLNQTNRKCLRSIRSQRLYSTDLINKHYDIIICGGGPAGISMACSISKNTKLSDRQVLVLDGAPKFKGFNADKYGNRVYAINKGTVSLLESIDVWDKIVNVRCQPVKQMQVWDACSDAIITLNHANFSDDMAYIVENDLVMSVLLQQLEQNSNITLKSSASISSVQLPRDGFESSGVTLKTGERYSCDLLIGADGANSVVRKQMGVDNFSLSYNQMGLIATVEISEGVDNQVAWQRFLPNGVIALLPLSENLSSIVWSSSTENVKHLLSLPEESFIDAVNDSFWKQYPKNQIVSNAMKTVESIFGNYSQTVRQLPPSIKSLYEKSRAAFPLGFGHTSTYAAKGCVLIGDAAHRVHPLAGQGLNLGFGDVKLLTELLAEASYSGAPLGNLPHLCAYERERLQHNVPIMLGIHGLQRLYSTDFSPIVLLRSVGLQLVNTIPPLKQLFINKAMH